MNIGFFLLLLYPLKEETQKRKMQLIVFHGCLCELEGKLSNPKLTQYSMPLLMLSAVFVTNACNFASGLTSSVMFLNPNSWRLQHHHFFNSIGDSAQCEK